MSPGKSKESECLPGDLVDLYDEGEVVCAVVTGEEKSRLKVVTSAGRSLRVAPSRVIHRARPGAVVSRAESEARDHEEAVRERLGAVDTIAMWEVLIDTPRVPPRYTLSELSELACGEADPVGRSATLRALLADRTRYNRKGEVFEPRSREHVEETLRREAAEALRRRRREAFLDAARAALRGEAVAAPDRKAHAEWVADLVELAIMGEEAPARAGAGALLDEAGAPPGPPEERAFGLLHAMGCFTRDENLFVHRFGLGTAFPHEVEEAADAAAARPIDRAGRRDLEAIEAFTIDDDRTTEMDDAISLETDGPHRRVGVHIADPGCFVDPGGAIDAEALRRAATFYFPDLKLPMLPPVLAEEAASLVEGAARPALSVFVTIGGEGEILDHEIVPSIIRSRARLTYEEADALVEAGGDGGPRAVLARALRALNEIAETLEARRIADGAVRIRAPECDIRVDPGGVVSIRRIEDRGLSRRLVAEMMILANRIAAGFCRDRSLPAIYRRQSPPLPPGPDAPPVDPGADSGAYDPVAMRALRRRMRRGEVGLEPGRHHGLGLDAYMQVTSPIRRYQDLVMHRQIRSAIAGGTPCYDAEAIARIAATTEEAERAARQAERGTDEYWILRSYESRTGQRVEGCVLACDGRRTEVELSDTLYTLQVPARPDHRPGLRIVFVVEAARPRARRLTLREDPS